MLSFESIDALSHAIPTNFILEKVILLKIYNIKNNNMKG